MSNLTLNDVIEIINGEDAFSHMDEIIEFSTQVDKYATDIFRDKSSEYSKGMLSLVQALTITVLVSRGDLPLMDAVTFISSGLLTKYTSIAMKMTVGLSVMEELR